MPKFSHLAPERVRTDWGTGHSQALFSLPVPRAISVLLLMFTRQVRQHRSLSKDQIPPRLSRDPSSYCPGRATGRWQGGRTRLPAAPVTQSVPAGTAGSASPLAAQVLRGALLGPRQLPPRQLRLQPTAARRSRAGERYF